MPITVPVSALNGVSPDPGIVFVWKAWTSFTQPQSNSTVPPRLGSVTASRPLPLSQLAISTMATQWAPVRFATRDRVGDVVGVAVGDQDVGGVHLVRGHGRGRVVRLQERVHEHPGGPVGELEASVAKESDLHLVQSSWFDSSG